MPPVDIIVTLCKAVALAALARALADALALALALSGMMYVCTAVGREANQVGVFEPANSVAITLSAAAEFVSANATRDDGSAVSRTDSIE